MAGCSLEVRSVAGPRQLNFLCAFATSSSNINTGKAEPPISCQEKGCNGIFIGRLPACETFYPSPTKSPPGSSN